MASALQPGTATVNLLPTLMTNTNDYDVLDTIGFENAAVDHQLSQLMDDMLECEISRVLVIYTGGTIGMKNTQQHGYIPVPNYLADTLRKQTRFHDLESLNSVFGRLSRTNSATDLQSMTENMTSPFENHLDPATMNGFLSHKLIPPTHATMNGTCSGVILPPNTPVNKICVPCFEHLPRSIGKIPSLITPPSLYGKRIRYSILEYDPLLDSCNVTLNEWARIARDIEANYELYDAFIVLHGTDTMAYTASALSFMLEDLGKTVIITGSQVPITEVRNDAVENLLGALTIAGHFVIPEVCLYFSNKLLRGNRSSKMDAVDFNAFESPNMRPLVNVGINIDVNWSEVLRPTSLARCRAHTVMNPNVGSLRLFPGITESTIRAFLAPPIQGVVLETYGAGNAPSARQDLIAALKEACDRGVVIVNCTQCKRGLVTNVYQTGKVLYDAGVVPGNDMTPECALTKLSYLLGHNLSVDKVREMMTKSLRGELTAIQPRTRFSYINRMQSLTQLLFRAADKGLLLDSHPAMSAANRKKASIDKVAEVSPTVSPARAGSPPAQHPPGSAIEPLPQAALISRKLAKFSLGSNNSNSSNNTSDASGASSQRTSFEDETTPFRPATAPIAASSSMKTAGSATATDHGGEARRLGSLPLSHEDQRCVERALYPLLVCGAAGSGDLEGLQRLWDVVTDTRPQHSRTRRAGGGVKEIGNHGHHHQHHSAMDDKDRGLLGGQAVTTGDGGLSLNQGDWEGRSPLHIACSAGYLDVVRFLLSHGASIHVRDRQNHTPLYDAATRSSDLEVVKLLRATGAHLNDAEVADCGWKLMIAATEGDQLRVALIAEAGFDLNRRLFDQRTVLHILAAEHRHEVLQFLLETYPRQLELGLKDRLGRTCVDEAGVCETCLALFEAYIQDMPPLQE
ncbi:hypothetical protein DFQ27_008018 [Actinomortierella ambigua]|uniref:asparaginase n=1 Tax=Actinomortierella ambigua TaxID=1343610 RepID=A0A9P6PTI1_9FUNG|nr:hypothetical protein DFQ27_008018 [Actinomortierella ambigua]